MGTCLRRRNTESGDNESKRTLKAHRERINGEISTTVKINVRFYLKKQESLEIFDICFPRVIRQAIEIYKNKNNLKKFHGTRIRKFGNLLKIM